MSHSKSNYEEIPRIRQVIFNLDKNKVYKFDVNNTTTIKGLKRMICAAANLNKTGLKIFSKGFDYTEFDDEDLSELFHDQSVVEFKIEVDRFCADLDTSKIRVDNSAYCATHKNKLLYLYCQECGKSICSICSKEGHRTHNTVEKYDYLQSSRVLVDQVFKDFQWENILQSDRKLDAEELKKKISAVYFPELHHLLNLIEKNQLDLIDHFIKTSDISFTNIAENNKIKEHYVEGLDKLKVQLDFEKNLLKDDEVFVHFDRKYNEINQEKLRIREDGKKFEQLNHNFNQIAEIINSVHYEVFDFLDKKYKEDKYSNLKQDVDNNAVSHVSKDDIFDKLLSEVSVNKSIRKSMRRSKSPVPRQSQAPGQGPQVSQYQNKISTSNISPINPNATVAPKDIAKGILPGGKLDTIFNLGTHFNNGNKSEKGKDKNPFQINIPDTSDDKISNILSNTEVFPPKDSNSLFKNTDKQKSPLPKPFVDYSKYIMRPETGTKNIHIYNDSDGDMFTEAIDFPLLCGTKEFLPNCAWVNRNGRLYISGGLLGKDTGSKSFFNYNPETKILEQMSEMTNARYSHSLISHGDFIYAVGGSSNPTTEKYDFKENKWIKLSNLTLDERQNPILYVYKDQLYAFFGYKAGGYVETVEKLKMSTRGKWEIVAYKNPNKINLKLIGCGTVPFENSNDKIYFFGGRGSSEFKHNAFIYDFSTTAFSTTPIGLEEHSFFCESGLFKLSDGSYGGFDMERGNHFLKLDLN